MDTKKSPYAHTPKSAWEGVNDAQMKDIMDLGESYKTFLDFGKTERKCVERIVKEAEAKDYKSLEYYIEKGSINPGDKVYAVNHGKAMTMMVMGSELLEKGMRIIGSHLDSPRLDLKPSPLYEDSGLGLLKTHYYGGIKKYQWASIPLALYGVVVLENGKKIDIAIGDDMDDPILFIPDLLIHLWKDQASKK